MANLEDSWDDLWDEPSTPFSFTPLFIAAQTGDNIEVVRLLSMKVTPDGYDHSTLKKILEDLPLDADLPYPLHVAAYNGHVETVKILLRANAYVGYQNIFREDAISAAVWNGEEEVLDVLLNALEDEIRSDILRKTASYHQTLVMKAFENDLNVKVQASIIGKLVSAKCDINQTTYDTLNTTALIHAAETNNAEIVQILLDAKADMTIQRCDFIGPRDSISALEVATNCGHTEVVRILSEHQEGQRGGHQGGLQCGGGANVEQ